MTQSALKDRAPTEYRLIAKAKRIHFLEAELRKFPGKMPLSEAMPWLRALAVLYKRARTTAGQTRIVAITRLIADNDQLRAEADALCRLSSDLKQLIDWIDLKLQPTSAERIAARENASKKAEAYARKMLALHEKRLKQAKVGIQKWKKRVDYYDKKKEMKNEKGSEARGETGGPSHGAESSNRAVA